MTEPQIRALFAEEADLEPPPSPIGQTARLRGRARLRWRRAGVTGTAALAAAAIAALAVGVIPAGPASVPVNATGPAAPRQFSVLITNVWFGWLPAGQAVSQGGVEPTVAFVGAAGTSPVNSWQADLYAQGKCHLTSHDSALVCPSPTLVRVYAKIAKSAPAVNGHRAFWTPKALIWQYARGGWAWLYAPVAYKTLLPNEPQVQRTALRIARHLVMGPGTPRLTFPAQFSRLGPGWRAGESHYSVGNGTPQAQDYTLFSSSSRFLPHVGDLGIWANAVYVIAQPATTHGTCSPNDPATRNHTEVIHGIHVVIKHGTTGGQVDQELCSAHADGLWFDVEEFGPHPPIAVAPLFRDHVRLLGGNPAKWTDNPIK